MYRRSVKLVLVVLLVVCVGGILPVWSQSTSSGTVSGSVIDQSNAVVAGATITMTDSSQPISRELRIRTKTGRYILCGRDARHSTDIYGREGRVATTKTARTRW